MTPACTNFVSRILDANHKASGDVLEVGSRNINGVVRDLVQFRNRARFPNYIGVDMIAGVGVDRVCKADQLPWPDRTFGVVVSTEMLEHDNRFWLSLLEFHRVLKSSGLVILTTRSIGFPRHDHPCDYWRFTADGLRTVLEWAGFKSVDTEEDLQDRGTFGSGYRD